MFSEKLGDLHGVKCSLMLLFLYYIRHITLFLTLFFIPSEADREILSLRLMQGLMAAHDFFFHLFSHMIFFFHLFSLSEVLCC